MAGSGDDTIKKQEKPDNPIGIPPQRSETVGGSGPHSKLDGPLDVMDLPLDTRYTVGVWKGYTPTFSVGSGVTPWSSGEQLRPRGGSGRGMRFDRALLEENIRSQWRFLMLEEPANLGGLVAEYMGDVRRMGMSLNLDAWLLQRARRDPRYHLLYSRKPAELGEAEYISSLRGVAEQYGFSGRVFSEQVTAAAASGQSAAGFSQRAADTRPARVNNIGLFSRKVAQALAQLGPLGRGSV